MAEDHDAWRSYPIEVAINLAGILSVSEFIETVPFGCAPEFKLESFWHLEAEGVLRLHPTRITITWRDGEYAYVCVDGRRRCACGNVKAAKYHAMEHVRDMLEMGYDP